MSAREFRDRLRRRARRAGLDLAPDLAESLERYYALLSKWNAKINLTSFQLAPGRRRRSRRSPADRAAHRATARSAERAQRRSTSAQAVARRPFPSRLRRLGCTCAWSSRRRGRPSFCARPCASSVSAGPKSRPRASKSSWRVRTSRGAGPAHDPRRARRAANADEPAGVSAARRTALPVPRAGGADVAGCTDSSAELAGHVSAGRSPAVAAGRPPKRLASGRH